MTDRGRHRACGECLRRLQLVGTLAPFIENVATGEPGSRSPELLALGDEALVRAVAPRKADGLLAELGRADLSPLRRHLRDTDCWVVCRHCDAYPEQLHNLGDAPPALVGRGDPAGLSRLRSEGAVTVVGARRATSYGREIARDPCRRAGEDGLRRRQRARLGDRRGRARGGARRRLHRRRAGLRRRCGLPAAPSRPLRPGPGTRADPLRVAAREPGHGAGHSQLATGSWLRWGR